MWRPILRRSRAFSPSCLRTTRYFHRNLRLCSQEVNPEILRQLEKVKKTHLKHQLQKQEASKIAERIVDTELGHQLEDHLEALKQSVTKLQSIVATRHAIIQDFKAKQQQKSEAELQALPIDEFTKQSLERQKRNMYNTLKETIERQLPVLITSVEKCLQRYQEILDKTQQQQQKQEEGADLSLSEIQAIMQEEKEEPNHTEELDSKDFLATSTELTKLFVQLFSFLGFEMFQVYSAQLTRTMFAKDRLSTEQFKEERKLLRSLSYQLYQHLKRVGMLTSIQHKQLPSFIEDDFVVPIQSISLWMKLMHLMVEVKDHETALQMLKDMQELDVTANSLIFRHLIRLLLHVGQTNQVKVLVEYMKKCNIKPDSETNSLLLKMGLIEY